MSEVEFAVRQVTLSKDELAQLAVSGSLCLSAERLADVPEPDPYEPRSWGSSLRSSGASFQERVAPWMDACFGPEISNDRLERGDRFLEEALELLQSGNYPRERIAALTEYVFDRPQGEINQEVGGVMVTLAAYCLAFGLDMHAAGETELARIWTKVEKIRAKQAAKPTGSALPVAHPSPVKAEHPQWIADLLNRRTEVENWLRAPAQAQRKGRPVPPPPTPDEMERWANRLGAPTEVAPYSAQPTPTDDELGGAYVPKIIEFDGEGDPHWEFVERDCATITNPVFAANVEALSDLGGSLVGFRIYKPGALNGARSESE